MSGFAITDVVLASIGFLFSICTVSMNLYLIRNYETYHARFIAIIIIVIILEVLFGIIFNVSAIIMGSLAMANQESESLQTAAIVVFWILIPVTALNVGFTIFTCLYAGLIAFANCIEGTIGFFRDLAGA